MSSFRKYKDQITQDEVQFRPVKNKEKKTDAGIKINNKEVVLNKQQIKELIKYLIELI